MDVDALASRLTALEAQVAELADRVAPAADRDAGVAGSAGAGAVGAGAGAVGAGAGAVGAAAAGAGAAAAGAVSGAGGAGGAGGDPEAAGDAGDREVFWALHGLRERVAREAGAVLFTGFTRLPTGERYEWQHGSFVDDVLDHDWSTLSAALAALGHPVRLLLLRQVLGGARSTAELQAHERLGTTGQLYHHLRLLLNAGWLRLTTRGHYAVPAERVVPLLIILSAAE